jgi:hypothetical protein
MYWDKLPPTRVEDCPHRLVTDPGQGGGGAVCNLLAQAGVPTELCGVRPDVCSACLRQDPPAPGFWNTVMASLVYARSSRAAATDLLPPGQREKLAQLRDEASRHLEVADGPALAEEPAPINTPAAGSLRELLPAPKPRGRHRVRQWAAGVVSSPRRRPTLGDALDSMARAGWGSPYLFLDGTVRVPGRFAHLPGVLREPRIGCWPNHYLALAELVMRHPDADAYLLAEDDALFFDGEVLREYLEEMLWPSPRGCIVSLYCSSANSRPDFGWQPLAEPWAWGSLALIFPRPVAQHLLLDRSVCGHRWDRWQEEHGGLRCTDFVIGQWAWKKRIPVWYPTPSLVQHIGATSTLGLDRQAADERRADLWAGDFIASPRH